MTKIVKRERSGGFSTMSSNPTVHQPYRSFSHNILTMVRVFSSLVVGERQEAKLQEKATALSYRGYIRGRCPSAP